MKNFLRSFIASDRDNNSREQKQPESIELNEQELENATGGCDEQHHYHHHHHHKHYCHHHHCYDYCD